MGLGQIIGKVIDNFAITNDAQDKVQVQLRYDFSTASDNDIKSWLCGNRRIALQRPARAKSKVELEALNGMTIMAVDAGKKVKTIAEQRAEAKAILAALKVAHPEEYQAIMDELDEEVQSETQKAMAGVDEEAE